MNGLESIYIEICKLNRHSPQAEIAVNLEIILQELFLLKEKLSKQEKEKEDSEKRVTEILDVIMSLANLDYSKKALVTCENEYMDGLAAGINMLGEELQASTISSNEKEVLLKEVHHRVKNNLQVISSLLALQGEQIKDKTLLHKFQESCDRIKSMALIHEKIYLSKDLSKVNFGEYIKTLINSMNESYNPNKEKIKFHLQIGNSVQNFFKIDTAIPCGLILNELLSNCYKYAFPGNRSGNVYLSLTPVDTSSEKNNYKLELRDDGVGLPKGFNLKNPVSLGLQLVNILTEQLDGTLKIESNKGTAFTLTFPISKN
jgi:two-component sensor histidine kinase